MYVGFSFYKRLKNVKIKCFELQFLRSIKFWFGSKIHYTFGFVNKKQCFFFHRNDLFETSQIHFCITYANNLTNKKSPSRDILDKLDKYVPFFNWHTVKSQAEDCLV